MRLTDLITAHSKQVEPQRDYSFLSDAELNRLENLFGEMDIVAGDYDIESLSEASQREFYRLMEKTEGNVINSWYQQATLAGDESLRELYNLYTAFCTEHDYANECLMKFKKRLPEFGITVNSNIE